MAKSGVQKIYESTGECHFKKRKKSQEEHSSLKSRSMTLFSRGLRHKENDKHFNLKHFLMTDKPDIL